MIFGSFMPKRSVWDERIEALRREYPQHQFLEGLKPDSPEAADLDALLAGKLPDETYLASPRLKAIFQSFTGINHLPLRRLADRGVHVYNVHANAFDVAEKALAMTLAYYGRIVDYHNDLRKGIWHGFWVRRGAEDNWDSLFGRKCAILGTGAIGTELAKLLKAFHCEVRGWRRRPGMALPEGFDEVVGDLREAIDKAEIVFIALPATPLTDGLLTKDILATMKDKVLVNVGRGSIVDEEGLYLALKNGVLKAAAIDTWYKYPQGGTIGAPSRFPINELPNVILSPHVGGMTNQATARAIDSTVQNIRDFLDKGACASEADLEAMY
ncbi:MAG TPA: 2-hydroxyacid dehydrogenase [Rectinemataceae bacterium]|nr:2-hydroxyacid dehydrogenase [Rectinemataceae bacterium]